MNVEIKQIASSASSDDNSPWYDLSVSNGQVTVDEDGDGGHDGDLTGESVQIETSADSVIAVEKGGGLISYKAATEDPPSLRAHLAWYDSDADILTILEFVETEA